MLYQNVRLGDSELAIVRRHDVFQGILGPGTCKRLFPATGLRVMRVNLTEGPINSAALDRLFLSHPAAVREWVSVVETGEYEIAFVRRNGLLIDVIAPAHRSFFTEAFGPVTVERIDTQKARALSAALIGPLLAQEGCSGTFAARDEPRLIRLVDDTLAVVFVPRNHNAMLSIGGEVIGELSPGRYLYVSHGAEVAVVAVPTGVLTLEVAGQEVLTADRIGIRTTVTLQYRVADAARWTSIADAPEDMLYRQVQFAARRAIGTRNLESLLSDRQSVDETMQDLLADRAEDAGISLIAVGLKDIILPGDVRAMMNQVIEAEKTAMANVIRRREETAATRSLLNTAKLMEDNPTLLRLKELEVLERVTENVGSLVVSDGLDGVLDNLVRLTPREGAARKERL